MIIPKRKLSVRKKIRFFRQFFLMTFVAGLLATGCASVDSYAVRGVIVRLVPEQSGPGRIVLLHETIEKFKNEEGKKTKMGVMAMSFSLPERFPISEFHAGDKVAFHFDVRWKKSPRLQIRSMERLDPQTELNLEGYSVEESLDAAL